MKWLEARGLPKEGKAPDIRNRVAKYIEQNKVPDVIVTNNCSKENILEMIHSLSLMVHMMMSYDPNKYRVSDFEASIRFFLIRYDIVDTKLSHKDIPSWISQYNFLCLLNLPDTIKHYGHLRNLWEGGTNGEGYLKKVKNVLKPGLINQWQKWCITTLLKDQLYSEWSDGNSAHNLNVLTSVKQDCRVYGNHKNATDSIDSGLPFSGIVINSNNMYVCFREHQSIRGIEILLLDTMSVCNGVQYHSITSAKDHIAIDETNNIIGIIFLPKLTADDYHSHPKVPTEYCFIKSDWT